MYVEKKVSVIVNCYNGEKYLKRCIDSIIDQDYINLEVIFWDNNSSDRSVEIFKEYKDNRFKLYISSNTVNLYQARNEAIKKATGDLISFLDCDDWWNTNFLSSRKEIFHNSYYDFFYSNTNFYFNQTNKFQKYKKYNLPSGKIFKDLIDDYFIIISGLILRKKIFSEIGFFNKKYNIIGDYDFVMKIAQKYNAHCNNLPLLNYRVHQDNYSKKNREMFYLEYKDWYEEDSNDLKNKDTTNQLKKKLSYLEISYLIEKKKNFELLIKILKHKNFIEKLKFFILFFLPIKILIKLRK